MKNKPKVLIDLEVGFGIKFSFVLKNDCVPEFGVKYYFAGLNDFHDANERSLVYSIDARKFFLVGSAIDNVFKRNLTKKMAIKEIKRHLTLGNFK